MRSWSHWVSSAPGHIPKPCPFSECPSRANSAQAKARKRKGPLRKTRRCQDDVSQYIPLLYQPPHYLPIGWSVYTNVLARRIDRTLEHDRRSVIEWMGKRGWWLYPFETVLV